MKIPYPGDLNPIEIAVWAAEFVRERAAHSATCHAAGYTAESADVLVAAVAVEAANRAVDDLRRARGRQ